MENNGNELYESAEKKVEEFANEFENFKNRVTNISKKERYDMISELEEKIYEFQQELESIADKLGLTKSSEEYDKFLELYIKSETIYNDCGSLFLSQKKDENLENNKITSIEEYRQSVATKVQNAKNAKTPEEELSKLAEEVKQDYNNPENEQYKKDLKECLQEINKGIKLLRSEASRNPWGQYNTVTYNDNVQKESVTYNVQQESVEDKKLASLLGELALIQYNAAKTSVARGKRTIGKAIQDAKTEFDSYVKLQAEIYGQNKESYANVEESYKKYLEDLRKTYDESILEYTADTGRKETDEAHSTTQLKMAKDSKKQYLKGEEYKTYEKEYRQLEKEIEKHKKNKEFDEAIKKTEELKKLYESSEIKRLNDSISKYKGIIKTCRKDIKENKKNVKATNKKYKEIIEGSKVCKKETKALVEQKQSVFGKLFSIVNSTISKINGDSKFKKKVLDPITNKINNLREETLPELGKKVKAIPENVMGIIGKVKEQKDNIIREFKSKIEDKINIERQKNIGNVVNQNDTYKLNTDGITIGD